MGRRVLVTGATGFVGSHLVDSLLTANSSDEILATRRYHLSNRQHSKHFEEKVTWVDCNLQDPIATEKMMDAVAPDIIFHCAAESFVSPSWNHPLQYMNMNYGSTVNLLESLRRANSSSPIHIPGSGEEYGDIDVSDLPITQATVLNPVNPYAVTKIAQDLIAYVYHRSYGINAIRTRAFNHEGPRRENVFGISSYAWQIARIENGRQNSVIETGDIDDRRNFTDVRDMVRAYQIAVKKCVPGELYLVGSNSEDYIFSFREVLEKLISFSTVPKISYRQVQKFTRPTQVPFLIADVSKFTEVSGWKPEISMEQMLRDILDYWRIRVRNDMS